MGGCYSAEMRRPAIRSTAEDPMPVCVDGGIPVYLQQWARSNGRRRARVTRLRGIGMGERDREVQVEMVAIRGMGDA